MDDNDRSKVARKLISAIATGLNNYEYVTGLRPEHITVSVDDFMYLKTLCVVTVSADTCKNQIMGIDCSISRNVRSGQFFIGKKYDFDPNVYFEIMRGENECLT